MRQQHFVMQPRHWSATSAAAWRLEESYHSLDRHVVDLNWQGQPFHLVSSSACGVKTIPQFRRRLSVRSILNRLLAAGYRSRRPTRCPRLTLDHRQRRRVYGKTHRGCDCVFSDASCFMLFHSDGHARGRHRQGERLIYACIQPTEGNLGLSVMVWGAILYGWSSELVVLDGTFNHHCYIRIHSDIILPWTKLCVCPGQMPRPTQHVHKCFSGTTGCGGHGLVRSEYKHAPHWVCLGPNRGLDMRHVWPTIHCVRIATCRSPGVGCSSS